MKGYSTKIAELLRGNKIINKYFDSLLAKGTNPWELSLIFDWKDIGKIMINSFEISDFWALKDFWIYGLGYASKNLFPLFPSNHNLDRASANHFKNHQKKRDIIFNAWLIKEGSLNADFDNEIIGHFFLSRCEIAPEPGLAVSDKYQGKKLGTFFLILLIYITKLLNKKIIYIRTDSNNIKGFELYKKLGFKHIKDSPLEMPVVGYKGIIRELEMDLQNYL